MAVTSLLGAMPLPPLAGTLYEQLVFIAVSGLPHVWGSFTGGARSAAAEAGGARRSAPSTDARIALEPKRKPGYAICK